MRVARYLTTAIARAVVVNAIVAAALLNAVDALDPTARGQSLSEAVPRALWLSSAALVIALALAPAAVLASLVRTGGARALRTAGASLSLALLVPVTLASLAGAPCAGALALEADRMATLHPGSRPQPLDVVPWGAPTTGCWREDPSGAVFVRAIASHSRSEATSLACGRSGSTALPWLLSLAALLSGPASLVATARSRARGVWVGAALALLALVAGVVAGAHVALENTTAWGMAVVLLASATGALSGRWMARWSGDGSPS